MASLDGNIAVTLHLILYKDTPVAVGPAGAGAKAENRAQPRLDVFVCLLPGHPGMSTLPTATEELQWGHNMLRRRLCVPPSSVTYLPPLTVNGS